MLSEQQLDCDIDDLLPFDVRLALGNYKSNDYDVEELKSQSTLRSLLRLYFTQARMTISGERLISLYEQCDDKYTFEEYLMESLELADRWFDPWEEYDCLDEDTIKERLPGIDPKHLQAIMLFIASHIPDQVDTLVTQRMRNMEDRWTEKGKSLGRKDMQNKCDQIQSRADIRLEEREKELTDSFKAERKQERRIHDETVAKLEEKIVVLELAAGTQPRRVTPARRRHTSEMMEVSDSEAKFLKKARKMREFQSELDKLVDGDDDEIL